MNPVFYLKVFAWIAITGLCCIIFNDSWLPILIGTVVLTVVITLITSRRN